MKGEKHYTGHRERLRQRLGRDSRQLADYEVLELLLGYVLRRSDTKPLAKALLARFGTIRGVFSARPEDLRRLEGFGPGLETFWSLWRETWARLSESPLHEKEVLGSPEAVAAMAMARLGHKATEEFWMALVDTKNRLVGWEPLAQGTVDQAAVYVREVMHTALRFEAHGIVLVHNHPGGSPEPSNEDKAFTARAVEAARTLGIRLLDHIIVAESGYFSFHSEGLLG